MLREQLPDTIDGDPVEAYAAHLRGTVSEQNLAERIAHIRELVEVSGKPAKSISHGDAQAFLSHILRTPGPRTQALHEKRISTWRRQEAGKRRAQAKRVTRPEPPRARTAATRNHALKNCKAFFSWLSNRGEIRKNPFAGIRRMAETPPEIEWFSVDERDRLLEASAELPGGLAVWIALLAGLRLKEIALLPRTAVHLRNKILRIQRTKTSRAMNSLVRVVPIHDRLLPKLKFCATKKSGTVMGWPTTSTVYKNRSRDLLGALRAELPDLAERIGFNAFRHTFCTLLLDAGVAPGRIIQWSGHTPQVFWRNYAGRIREYDERINV